MGKSKNVNASMLATTIIGVIGFVTKVYDDTTTISLLSWFLHLIVKSEDDISRYDNKAIRDDTTQ